jgi:hypothetical protein
MKTWSIWVTAGLMGSTAACAGGSQTGGLAPNAPHEGTATTEDADALFAREATAPLHAVPISVLEGAVTGTAPAASTPVIKSEENSRGELITVVDIPIGTHTAINCVFRTGRVDPGMAVGNMMAAVSTKEAQGRHTFSPEVSVAVSEGVPILMATSPFLEHGAPSLAKVAVAAREDGTVLCSHFEAGYRATFAKEVAGLVGSLKFTKASTPPRWREIRLLEKGTSVAFQERQIWSTDKPGQLASRSTFAGFIEIEGHWVGIDGASDETYESKGGAVIEKTTALAAGGTLISRFKLTRKRGGEYAYEGKRQGESLSGTFATKTPITTESSRAGQVRAWLGGHANETRFVSYDETENAKGAIDIVYKREAGRAVTVETRGAKVSTVRCTFDSNGFCENQDDATDGSRETRLFVRGAL